MRLRGVWWEMGDGKDENEMGLGKGWEDLGQTGGLGLWSLAEVGARGVRGIRWDRRGRDVGDGRWGR